MSLGDSLKMMIEKLIIFRFFLKSVQQQYNPGRQSCVYPIIKYYLYWKY